MSMAEEKLTRGTVTPLRWEERNPNGHQLIPKHQLVQIGYPFGIRIDHVYAATVRVSRLAQRE